MSQIRKSASFRSRIPVRRTKPVPRRCYSPEPYTNISTPSMFEQDHKNYATKHSNHAEQRTNKQKLKRQRHVATTLAQQLQYPIKSANDTTTTSVSNFPGRPKTIYSSSSYSSSDESQESESPPQYQLKQSASSAADVRPPLNVSTDAMSLDGILDSISCGSISSPPSPANYLSRHDSYSSYDSLDKYNYALETLKLSDSGNYFNGNVKNCMLQPKCRQPYVHNDRKMDSDMVNDELNTPKLPPRPPLPKTSQSSTTIDKDLAKQQQLSDWYYIKTGPKSPLPTPRSETRNGFYNSPSQTTVNRTTANNSNNNNNTSEGIYVSRETTKNHFNAHSQNMIKRVENDNSRLDDIVQIAKPDDNKNDKDTIGNVYKTINVPSSCDDIRKLHIPSNHQYSVGEPLCKFNYRNNSEKVNGCLKRQQPQDIQHRIPLISPPSPSVTSKNVQTHPFYYVEPSQKHFSSPRQDKQCKQNVDFQQKLYEPQCEQIQAASNSQSHNNRLNPAASATTATIMTSNSNSNIHKLTGVHLQPSEHCGNANSSSFEHVNVTSGFSSLSASSEMTIDDKRRFNSQNYVDDRTPNNAVGETITSSPSLPIAHQS